MNWWKSARVNDFEDRNRVNMAIHKLSTISENLKYASDLVFMTQRGARKMVEQMRESKTLSNYPEVVAALEEADRVVLDSPKKFAVYCQQSAQALDNKIAERFAY